MQEFEKIERAVSKELELILGKPFYVLNDGFVRVIDYFGNDSSIVQAARVSYGKGTKKINEDSGLIKYLLKNKHTSPFEMCEIKLHIRIPMDSWRQYVRHRTANISEYSTRYSIAIDCAQNTNSNEWRKQAKNNKQGSDGFIDEEIGKTLSLEEKEIQEKCKQVYNNRLSCGVAKEQARKDLPLSTYTEAYWKIDLHNLLHFLSLRMDPHAQYEIRQYANIIGNEIVGKWCPITWKAFLNYNFNSMSFSLIEQNIITNINRGDNAQAIVIAKENGWLEGNELGLKHNSERFDFEQKLLKLGFLVPWKKEN